MSFRIHNCLDNLLEATSVSERESAAASLRAEVHRMENRLAEVADLLADQGKIINTPGCKRRWIEGE